MITTEHLYLLLQKTVKKESKTSSHDPKVFRAFLEYCGGPMRSYGRIHDI